MAQTLSCVPALEGGRAPTVNATGSMRRLRGLAYNGWSGNALAARLGVTERVVEHIQRGRRGRSARIQAWLAAAVSALYDELWDKRGGCEAVARVASKRGYAPPLAWDDNPGDPHFIDDPACEVSDWRPRRRWRAHTADRAEDIRDVMAAGYDTPALAALRLGISCASVDKVLSRAARAS